VARLFAALALFLLLAGATDAKAADGEELYRSICAPCHQANSAGVPGVYPPLADHIGRFVRIPEGRRYLGRVVTHGLFGPIEVEGTSYAGLMPPQAQLSDEDVAAVLNYSLTEFSPEELPSDFKPLTAQEVAGYREPQTGPSLMVEEREALVQKLDQQSLLGGAIPRIQGAAQDYSRWCQGCHGADGMGAVGAVPRLRGFVGYFTHSPRGRAYLAGVPGVVLAPLDDQRLAAVLNWTLLTFSPDLLPPDFQTYTAAEIAAARRAPVLNAQSARVRLIDELQAAGTVPPHADGLDRPSAYSGG
jgi:mono/diheme cytochrome c family protein